MIRWQSLEAEIGRVISDALRKEDLDSNWIRSDVKEPIGRRSFRLDISNNTDYGTEFYAERACEVEIYFYPGNKERPKNELNTAAQCLRKALRAGITVENFLINVSDSVESDTTDGVLSIIFQLDWIETASDSEDAEFMELLKIKRR